MKHIFDKNLYVWRRKGFEGIAYSDGEEAEKRIFETVRGARDKSTFSTELLAGITDWPSEYHLSRSRHCLIRPLGIKPGQKVLELGCGCGAITRYLGEIGAEVTAVEGAKTRARTAAERCRDLPNVKIVLDDLLQFQAGERFDWVLLVGVLEYAPVYSSAPDPVGHYLAYAGKFLRPQGKLVVAIENRLGLKYFSGCTEDHVGKHFFGIQNLYDKHTPVTFGRNELIEKLAQAQFVNTLFYYPFPDYKLPSVILAETACRESGFNISDLLLRCHARDYTGWQYRFFDESMVFPVLARNGLIEDFSNSFLVVAAKHREPLTSTNTLAWTFALNRLPRFATQTSFVRQKNKLLVKKGLLIGSDDGQSASTENVTIHHRVKDDEYVYGRHLLWRIVEAKARGESVELLVSAFSPWFEYLLERARPTLKLEEKTHKRSSLSDHVVSGELVDCTPFNLLDTDSGFVPIDHEWQVAGDIPLGWVITRSVFGSLHGGWSVSNPLDTGLRVVKGLCSKAGLAVTEEEIREWTGLEKTLQILVTGNESGSISPYGGNVASGLLNVLSEFQHAQRDNVALSQSNVERDGQIAALTQAVAKRDEQLVHLNQAVAEREAQVASLSQTEAERDGQVAALKQAATERDGQIAALNHAVTERDRRLANLQQTVAEHGGQLAALNRAVTERDERIASLNQAVTERDGQISILSADLFSTRDELRRHQVRITELEAAVTERSGRIDFLSRDVGVIREALGQRDAAIQEIYRSTSWRVTAPLRALKTFLISPPDSLQRARGRIGRFARFIYRRIPMPETYRRKLKDFVYLHFGFLISNTATYRFWSVAQTSATPDIAHGQNLEIQEPPLCETTRADVSRESTREISDYDLLSQKIAEYDSNRTTAINVAPPRLTHVAETNIDEYVAKLNFPRATNPIVSIIIPAYNHARLTLECLTSIAHCTSNIQYEVIVVDDFSTDQTARSFSSISNLLYLRNSENQGFIRTCNRGASEARGKYLLFLNNDAQVTHGWMDALVDTFESSVNVGAVGPKILYPNGRLQEAGALINRDCSATLIGVGDDPNLPRYNYLREVDYCSGACLLVERERFLQLGGFNEDLVPAYCEDSDLCFRLRQLGLRVLYNPAAVIVHHLSATSDSVDRTYKNRLVIRNQQKMAARWQEEIDRLNEVRLIAFYLPQFHPISENDRWWGKGFTEWSSVAKARPNFVGHYQPHLPADLGFYDLRVQEVMQQQAELARRYGIYGFCYYYYWFAGHRILDMPLERMLTTGVPDLPFCLCWANENWTRRWDGMDQEILLSQRHSVDDDKSVIADISRYIGSKNYIRVNDKPLLLIYRADLFPDIRATIEIWRDSCRRSGIGEIYLATVESFDNAARQENPSIYGFDAAVEFPPHQMGALTRTPGEPLNPDFRGTVYDYRETVMNYIRRDTPAYTRFQAVMPSWDNTARMQNQSGIFVNATPGGYQAWLERALNQTRQQNFGDERIVFINAWNEWAEGTHLEPDQRFGHAYLEATRNAIEADLLRPPMASV